MEIQDEQPKRHITRIFQCFMCVILCFSLLVYSCRSDEVKVSAITGVDDAAEIFAGAGIAYEVGLVIIAGLVACGMSFATGKDAAQCAVEVYNKGNASFKQQAINTANVSAAAGMSFCTWEAAGWTDFCNLTKQTFDFTTLTNDTQVINIPIRTLANVPFHVPTSYNDSMSGTPTFTSTAKTFMVSDSGITFGMSPVYPLGIPHFATYETDITKLMGEDSYFYYMIPTLGLTMVGSLCRDNAYQFWYHGSVDFCGAQNRASLVDHNDGPWSPNLFVHGERLTVKWDGAEQGSNFSVSTADGVAFPQTGGDVIKGKWSTSAQWWKDLAAAAAAGSLGARLGDKNYYPGIDDVLNPANKETKLKTDTTVQKEIDKTAQQTRDVQAAPTTSTTTSTANSDITGGTTSSSPSTSSTTSKIVDGADTNVSSSINGNAANDLNNLMGLIDTLKAFFAFLAKAFSYLPPEFWILVIGGLVIVIILRVAGR